ncbi:hypothetical protein EDB87DRAFT_1822156 [Lactarius vividus]|nr:hypothetical protein EDB87DRAFT_1822156 [Lactarius vividus]
MEARESLGIPRAHLGRRKLGRGDAASASALLRNNTALQEGLAAQLAQIEGQLRRNTEHFSGPLAAYQGVLRVAEEKVGMNLDVMKRERVRLQDHRRKAPGTTCLTIASVIVITFWSCFLSFGPHVRRWETAVRVTMNQLVVVVNTTPVTDRVVGVHLNELILSTSHYTSDGLKKIYGLL